MLKSSWYVFKAELTLLLRHSHEWLYPIGFFIIVISLFPLALTPDPSILQKYIPGCIWIAALLANMLSVQTIFLSDVEDGNLEQWLLCQTPLTLLLLGKLAAQWLVTQLSLILLTPLLGVMFHLPFFTIFALCCSLVIGTPILILLGSFTVALTIGLRQQGVLLGLLFLPLVTPVLIFGVNIVQQAQAGFAIAGPLAFLAGLSLFTITLLPCAIAATLRVGVDD